MSSSRQTHITLRDKDGRTREFVGPPNGDAAFRAWFGKYLDALDELLVGDDRFRPSPIDPMGRYFFTNADGDELELHLDEGYMRRARTIGPNPQEAFGIASKPHDYLNAATNFALRGFDMAVTGKWYPTFAPLALAKMRAEFENTDPMVRMDPRDVSWRLAELGALHGSFDVTDGVQHATYRTPAGVSIVSWFAQPGRGIVVIHDPESPLHTTTKTGNAAFLTGVPKDLAALAQGVLATAVLVWAEPVALSAGTLAALHKRSLSVAAAGTTALVDSLSLVDGGTPGAWSEALDSPLQGLPSEQVAADQQDALNEFLDLWEADGYDSRWGLHHVLTLRTAASRRDAMSAIETLGLHVVDRPKDSQKHEVWVLSDPRIANNLEIRS